MVLITKGGGRDFRDIGIAEVLCKTTTVIINLETHFGDRIPQYDTWFWGREWDGTVTLEAKILQHIMAMREAMLHEIFLDLQKAYNTLGRDRCIDILAVYGGGPRTLWLLRTYWSQLQMVSRSGGYYDPPLKS